MYEEIKLLEDFLTENIDNLSKEDIDLINEQIELMRQCNENFNRTLLTIETDQDIQKKINKDLKNYKGYTYV